MDMVDSVAGQEARKPACSGGRLVAADGRRLPLLRVRLSATAGGGLARSVLEQTFVNPSGEALAVTYQLPLPAGGAVAGFAFRIGERRITGEIDRREAARERFEEAIASGRSAALLEQDRSSLFTQEIGNLPAGVEVVAEITVDQPLPWVAGGCWEWRFPTVVAPRYLGADGRVGDAGRLRVDVAAEGLPPRLEVGLSIRDRIAAGGSPSSPSHGLRWTAGAESVDVGLEAGDGVRLDRDVVVRWPVAAEGIGSSIRLARPAEPRDPGAAFGLLTLVPPAAARAVKPLGRDVIVLLDTSGSMSGRPIERARQVASAIVETLGEADRLELIRFSNRPERFARRPLRMTGGARAEALGWIASLDAGGGTEMQEAIAAALQPLDAATQRQVVLVTDGLIGFEQEVVRGILRQLPASSRLHTAGIGSAVNRSLTRPAARAGRGVEVVLGLDDDLRAAVRRILDRMCAPIVVDLEVSGSAVLDHAPERLPDLFAGAPALVAVRLRPEGGELRVRGRGAGGPWEQTIAVAATAPGEGRPEIVSCFGREAIEDLEMRLAAGVEPRPDLEARIEEVGLGFRLASRLTSWVAVSSEPGADPRRPIRRERIPQDLPYGLSVEGLGLRPAAGGTEAWVSECAWTLLEPRDALYVSASGLPERPGEAETGEGATLRGRVRLRRKGRLVVEIAADGSAWEVPDRVQVLWTGGRTLEAEVDRGRTTRPGRCPKGRWIRLTLRLPEGARPAPPSAVRFATGRGEVTVILEA